MSLFNINNVKSTLIAAALPFTQSPFLDAPVNPAIDEATADYCTGYAIAQTSPDNASLSATTRKIGAIPFTTYLSTIATTGSNGEELALIIGEHFRDDNDVPTVGFTLHEQIGSPDTFLKRDIIFPYLNDRNQAEILSERSPDFPNDRMALSREFAVTLIQNYEFCLKLPYRPTAKHEFTYIAPPTIK